MPSKSTSKFSPATVLWAASRRDALLRGRRVLPALAAIAALQGCVGADGGARAPQHTLGRQLTDLKEALESGAISEREYQVAKDRLLGRC